IWAAALPLSQRLHDAGSSAPYKCVTVDKGARRFQGGEANTEFQPPAAARQYRTMHVLLLVRVRRHLPKVEQLSSRCYCGTAQRQREAGVSPVHQIPKCPTSEPK